MEIPKILPKAVLFDLDNTLYNYDRSHQIAFKAATDRAISLKLFERAEDFEKAFFTARGEVKELVPHSSASHNRALYFQRLVENVVGILKSDLVVTLEDEYWNTFLESMEPGEGPRELLTLLKSLGCKLGLVTDMTTSLQHRKLVRLGISGIFQTMVSSEEVGIEKPAPIVAEVALKRLGVRAQETWLVGDSPSRDVVLANRLGMFAILVETSPDRDTHDKTSHTNRGLENLRVSSLTELADFVKKICPQ